MYAVLCACGREKEAEAAARRISFASLAYLNSSPLLRFMTVEHYQRLIRFMVARDQRMREIVIQHQKHITSYHSSLRDCSNNVHQLYSSNIVAPIQDAFEADPCVRVVEALGLVSSAPFAFPLCEVSCRYNTSGLRKYAEGLLKELVEMAENLPWVD